MAKFGELSSAAEVWTTAMKTATETVTESTTFQDDDHLTFAVAATTNYAFRMRIFYGTAAAADFKYQLTGPNAPTLVRYQRHVILPGATIFTLIGVTNAFIDPHILANAGTTGGYVYIDGILHNGANAGNVTLQWAQNTSDASNTDVYSGSYLEWMKI